jgi:O-antigen/teichoic acid export membrane protein
MSTAVPSASPARLRQLMRSTFSNYIGLVVHLGMWFLLTPFILNQLGSELYGLWVLVGAVIGYGTLLDFGIANAVTKYVAEYRARQDWSSARQIIGTALVLYSGLGMLLILAAALLAPFFADLFNIPEADRSVAMWLVVLSGVNLGLSIPCATTGSVLRGLQRFDLINLLVVIRTVFAGCLIVVVLLAGGGPVGIVIVNAVATLLIQIPSVWFIRRIAPEFDFSFRGITRSMTRRIASFSSYVFLIQVGGKLESQTDEIVIGAALPVAAIAPYNLARMLSTLPQMVTEQFLSLVLPLASEMDALSDRARLRALFVTGTRITLGVFLPIALVMMVLGGALLGAWVGEEYSAYGHLVTILVLSSMIDTSVWTGGTVLQGMARHRLNAIASVVGGFCNLGLSIILVRSMGLTGVALGTLIPTAVLCLGVVLPYAAYVTQTSVRTMVTQVLVPALAPAVPAGLVLLVIREVLAPASIVALLLSAMAGAVVYVSLYLLSAACGFERHAARLLLATARSHITLMRFGRSSAAGRRP